MGSDEEPLTAPKMGILFQSTLPAWGATITCLSPARYFRFQSTLPAWGATFKLSRDLFLPVKFQSTLPAWGATLDRLTTLYLYSISIHAPRMGSDQCPERQLDTTCISIHAPRMGSDPVLRFYSTLRFLFQSTLPAWGATAKNNIAWAFYEISIHAPRMGSDRYAKHPRGCKDDFNPRSPHGERQ